MNYAYVCNRQKSCNGSVSCGDQCRHTFDRSYAAYEDHDPENFDLVNGFLVEKFRDDVPLSRKKFR